MGLSQFLLCYSQSQAQDGAKEDVDAGSDIYPHTMEDEGEVKDNNSEEDEAVGHENALKLGESILPVSYTHLTLPTTSRV